LIAFEMVCRRQMTLKTASFLLHLNKHKAKKKLTPITAKGALDTTSDINNTG